MEKDKRKKALQIACMVFAFLCVAFAMYKLVKLDEKNVVQRQKQKETQEKEDKINAKCEAIKYMDEYTENLQEQMRKAGIDKNLSGDITIKKEPDQTYTLEQNRYARWLYVNGQEVYAKSRETNSTGSSGYSGNSSWGSSSGSSSKNDPYDVYDYDDPDEFADEWGEEFGDGSYEDGYDDAYDYWEEEMD